MLSDLLRTNRQSSGEESRTSKALKELGLTLQSAKQASHRKLKLAEACSRKLFELRQCEATSEKNYKQLLLIEC